MTGAYAEQAAKIINSMNENFIKERFYAIPPENLPRVNSYTAKPRMPFYHPDTHRRTEIGPKPSLGFSKEGFFLPFNL